MSDMSFEQLCELFAYAPKRRPLDSKEVAALLGIYGDAARTADDASAIRMRRPRRSSNSGRRCTPTSRRKPTH